jgi:hypothetical protein
MVPEKETEEELLVSGAGVAEYDLERSEQLEYDVSTQRNRHAASPIHGTRYYKN